MTTHTDSLDLHLQWADEEEDRYVSDLAGAAERVADDANEPEDTLVLACTAAIVSEGLGKALDHEWALYTPQQAAVATSALHATLQASLENLRGVAQAVRNISKRGDLTIPAQSGLVSPQEENLADALDRLATVADEMEQHLEHLPPAVKTLQAATTQAQLPANGHETVVGVAALLGDAATLNQRSAPGEHAPENSDDGCGCDVDFTHDGVRWNLHRLDSAWSLTREDHGEPAPDGGTTYNTWIDLPASGAAAHPAHLVALIRAALPS